MAAVPERILAAMENTTRELNELERRLAVAMDDSGSADDRQSPCNKCQELRQQPMQHTTKSPRKPSTKQTDKHDRENTCPSCLELTKRLDFMNDEMNRVCEKEAKLKDDMDALAMDFEMTQQELSIAHARIDGKERMVVDNLDHIDNLKSQILANSADRIASLQFELERKVDELQKLGEEHRYLLTLHYTRPASVSSTRRMAMGKMVERFGAEFFDMSSREECRKSLEKDLEAIAALKQEIKDNEKKLREKDSTINRQELDLEKLTQAYASLESQLKSYMKQFERLQGVVEEYKKREDEFFSRGVRQSDIMELEEEFPTVTVPVEANGGSHNHEEFFEELEELSNRLEETRRESGRHQPMSITPDPPLEPTTPKKKVVSFAVDCDLTESSMEVSVNETTTTTPHNDSKLSRIALLEQKAKAFEFRAENLCEELELARKTLDEVTEAREDLTELVQVQEERIALFLQENENLKSKLDRTIQESLDDSGSSDERVDNDFIQMCDKEEQLQSMMDEMEVRNCTIQDIARSVLEDSRLDCSRQNTTILSSTTERSEADESASMANEIQTLTARLDEMNRENELLNIQVDKAKNVIDSLKKQIVTSEDANATTEQYTLDRSYADNSQMDYMKHENVMLQEKLEHLQDRFAESEAEIAEKEKQLVHLRKVLETKSERVRQVEDEMEKKEVKISSYIAMIKKMKEAKKNDSEKSREDKEVEQIEFEQERAKFEAEKQRIEEEKKKVEKELNFAKLRYDDLKGQIEDLETDYENLTNELAQVHEAKSTMESDLTKSNERNNELRGRIENLEREVASRNVESQNAKSEKWALESEIAELKEQVEEMEAKLATKTEKGDANLIDENKYLKECVDETMDRLAEADAESLKLRTALDEAQSQMMGLEKDILLKDDRIEQLQAKADEIEDLRAQVQHSEDKRRLLEKVVLEKENYVTEMGTQLQNFTDKNELMEEELNTATKNVEVLQSALDAREKELELIHEEMTTEKTEKASLLDQVRNLDEKLKEAQSKLTFTGPLHQTPKKEQLLIDLESPKAKSASSTPRTFRIAKRIMTPAKRALNMNAQLPPVKQTENEENVVKQPDVLVDLQSSVAESQHQLSTSTLCFDLMERSIDEMGPLQPIKLVNETIVLGRLSAAPSQASFISGVGTVSTPNTKFEPGQKLDVDLLNLRQSVEAKAQDLLRQVEGLEVECEDLKSRCSKLEESNGNYQNLLQGSKESQKVLENRVLDLIQANHELQEKLKEKVEQCTYLANERDRLINEFGNADSLVRKLAVVEEEKRDLYMLLERLRCELNRIAGQNCKLNQQVNELNERLENVDCIESELDDYKQALEEVENQNTTLKVEMEEKIGQLTTEVTQAKAQFLQSKAQLTRYQNMENEFEDLNHKYGQVLTDNQHMYEEIQELHANLRNLQDIEKDFIALHKRNEAICKELTELESMLEDQNALKEANAKLEVKCQELCLEMEELKERAEKADYLSAELDKIRDHYEELLEAKSENESALEKNLSKLDLLDMNSKARLEDLHEDVRRAMEAKFKLELDLQQALKFAKESDNKHHRISNQLARIVEERNEIVSRLNQVTQKLNEKENLEIDGGDDADDGDGDDVTVTENVTTQPSPDVIIIS